MIKACFVTSEYEILNGYFRDRKEIEQFMLETLEEDGVSMALESATKVTFMDVYNDDSISDAYRIELLADFVCTPYELSKCKKIWELEALLKDKGFWK